MIETILTRRSIRKYTEEKISEEVVEKLLACAFAAPSAMNRRPFHVVVVDDQEMLKQISEAGMYTKMIANAPMCMVVCGDHKRQPFKEMLMNDCSAMIENILLAAHSLGLGAVWCGVMPRMGLHKKLSALLDLPMTVEPMGIVSLGYPAETKETGNRLEWDKVHRNKW